MQIEVRPIVGGEIEEWLYAVGRGFGDVLDAATATAFRGPHEPRRVLAAFDSGRIVGGANAYSLEMVIPGSRRLPMQEGPRLNPAWASFSNLSPICATTLCKVTGSVVCPAGL